MYQKFKTCPVFYEGVVGDRHSRGVVPMGGIVRLRNIRVRNIRVRNIRVRIVRVRIISRGVNFADAGRIPAVKKARHTLLLFPPLQQKPESLPLASQKKGMPFPHENTRHLCPTCREIKSTAQRILEPTMATSAAHHARAFHGLEFFFCIKAI